MTHPITRAIRASIAALLAAAGACTHAAALVDPIFNVEYQASEVRFDRLPIAQLLPACRVALSGLEGKPTNLTLFAQVLREGDDLYVVGSGEDRMILEVRGARCEGGLPSVALLQRHHQPPWPGDGPLLADNAADALMRDALDRYARAFGGRRKFADWLTTATDRTLQVCGNQSSTCPFTYRFYPERLVRSVDRFVEQARSDAMPGAVVGGTK